MISLANNFTGNEVSKILLFKAFFSLETITAYHFRGPVLSPLLNPFPITISTYFQHAPYLVYCSDEFNGPQKASCYLKGLVYGRRLLSKFKRGETVVVWQNEPVIEISKTFIDFDKRFIHFTETFIDFDKRFTHFIKTFIYFIKTFIDFDEPVFQITGPIFQITGPIFWIQKIGREIQKIGRERRVFFDLVFTWIWIEILGALLWVHVPTQ